MTPLLHTDTSDGDHAAAGGRFSEVSLATGHVLVNSMMYDTRLQRDRLEVSCKEFEDSNRMAFRQVVTDLNTWAQTSPTKSA